MNEDQKHPSHELYQQLEHHIAESAKSFRTHSIRRALGEHGHTGSLGPIMKEAGDQVVAQFVGGLTDAQISSMLSHPNFEDWLSPTERTELLAMVSTGSEEDRRTRLSNYVHGCAVATLDVGHEALFNVAETPRGRAKLKAELIATDPERARRISKTLGVSTGKSKPRGRTR